jgi:hypothetical protein
MNSGSMGRGKRKIPIFILMAFLLRSSPTPTWDSCEWEKNFIVEINFIVISNLMSSESFFASLHFPPLSGQAAKRAETKEEEESTSPTQCETFCTHHHHPFECVYCLPTPKAARTFLRNTKTQTQTQSQVGGESERKKDEKRAPKTWRQTEWNKTSSQTFLSRSTDKVLQPRFLFPWNEFSVSLALTCTNTQ